MPELRKTPFEASTETKTNILCFNKIWYDARCQKGTVGPGHWKMTWIDFIAFLSFLEQREFGLRLHETKGASPRIKAKERKGSHTCRKLSQRGCSFHNMSLWSQRRISAKNTIETMLTMWHRPTTYSLSSSSSRQPSRPMSIWARAHCSVSTSGRSTHWAVMSLSSCFPGHSAGCSLNSALLYCMLKRGPLPVLCFVAPSQCLHHKSPGPSYAAWPSHLSQSQWSTLGEVVSDCSGSWEILLPGSSCTEKRSYWRGP